MSIVLDGTTGITTPGISNSGSDAITGNQTVAGRSTFATTIGVGNATPSTSGAGITFPATQSASTNANTLDDYEEGTWTPTYLTDGVAFSSISYNTTFTGGRYVKVGTYVFLTGYLRTESITKGSASGNVLVGGMPFPVGTSGESTIFRTQCTVGGTNWVSNAPVQGNPNEGATNMYMLKLNAIGSATALAACVVADIGTGSGANIVQFGVAYIASA